MSKITVEDFNYKGVRWEKMTLTFNRENMDVKDVLMEFFDHVIRQTRISKNGLAKAITRNGK